MVKPLAILCLLASPVFAGWQETTLIRLDDGGAACVVQVGDKVRLLSCAHKSARENVRCGDRMNCETYNGQRFRAEVEKVDAKGDCSFWTFNVTLPIVPRKLAKTNPAPGETVWVCGFPQGTPHTRTATVINDDGDWLNLRGQAVPGESGGPIINSSGDVCGVLVAAPLTDGHYDGTSMCSRLAAIVALKTCPCGDCPGGICYPPQLVPVQPRPPVASRPPVLQQPPQPQVDQSANCEKQELEIKQLRDELDKLQLQVSKIHECQCGNVDAKITAAIAAIKFPQPQQPNYDAIALEVGKRLRHSAQITLLDGTTKTQTKPLSEPLEFVQHQTGVK